MKKIRLARVSQLIFLGIFAVLFVSTEYRGSDSVPAAINSFFRSDPLVLVSYLLSSRSFTWLLFPALLTVLFTLLLGRFFCGWICPLGTIIDLVTGRIAKSRPVLFLRGNFKYWLLLPLLVASLVHVNLAGILDPLAILVRGLTFFFYPIVGDGVRRGWVGLYRLLGDRRDYLDPAYRLLHDYLLPYRETFYPLAFLSALMFVGILFLERYERRNWCRNICPLGTLLGIFARFSIFSRSPATLCDDCKACKNVCPTVFREDSLQKEECFLCTECVDSCWRGHANFVLSRPGTGNRGFLPERRVLIGGALSGFLLAGTFRFRTPEAKAGILRPPGVRGEDEFLDKCVRCGECMKVCLRGALYPTVLQAGVEGVFMPMLIPRLGYCEYNCTLCGQVCPTGAIPNLEVQEKRRAVIGKSAFDKNVCIPYAKKTDCIVCEEHCPMPQKAIRTRSVRTTDLEGKGTVVQEPFVVEELCNGCGICENVCPLEGKAGIQVLPVKDRSPLQQVEVGTGQEADSLPYR